MSVYKINTADELIKGNPYVGRGIVIGKTEDDKCAVVAYFIMGRSSNSRNRVLVKRDGALYTEPFDASKVEDPSLIIYAALREYKNKLVVSNGDQTDTIVDALSRGGTFEQALETRTFEPDWPNFTPRISGVIDFDCGDFTYKMSILKSVDEDGTDCARFTFSYPSKAGLGHFLHTYVTDGAPIPSFQGEPERIIIQNDIDEFTYQLWEALDAGNKISLYTRYVDLSDMSYDERIINKNV